MFSRKNSCGSCSGEYTRTYVVDLGGTKPDKRLVFAFPGRQGLRPA